LLTCFGLIRPELRVGGGTLTDNKISHPAELAKFIRYLRSREDAHSVTIPVGERLEWTVKLG